MTYKSSRNLTLLFVAAIFFGGVYADHLPHRDFYPFFSWSLFSNVSHKDKSYFFRVKSDKDDNGVIIYGDRVSKYLNIDFLPNYYWDVQEIGKSLVNGVLDERLDKLVANFKVSPYSYEVIELEYDPWTLKQKGEYISLSVVKEFIVSADY